jgi:hypothetical protein
MTKMAGKIATNPRYDCLSCDFTQNRPPRISIDAGLSDFCVKFTWGSATFFDPLVIAPLNPSGSVG